MSQISTKKCPVCDFRCDSINTLHVHCVQEHETEFICCAICAEPIRCAHSNKSNEELVKHSKLFHWRANKNEIELKELFPDIRCKYDDRMVKGVQCMACAQYFPTRKRASQHYSKEHLMMKYQCHRCPLAFSSFDQLQSHYDERHRPVEMTDCVQISLVSDDDEPKAKQVKCCFEGFRMRSKYEAESKYLSFKRMRARMQRTAHLPRMGIKIQNLSMDFSIPPYHPHFYLTYRTKNRSIKLNPYDLNDAFIDLTV